MVQRVLRGGAAGMVAALALAGSAGAAPPMQPWPGGSSVVPVDQANALGAQVSGLEYDDTSHSPTRGVMYAVDDDNSLLLQLKWNGAEWVKDADWKLFYPD